jgi:hypothetical protein
MPVQQRIQLVEDIWDSIASVGSGLSSFLNAIKRPAPESGGANAVFWEAFQKCAHTDHAATASQHG